MANATVLPPLKFFQWSLPGGPSPKLAAPVTASATTLTFTVAPKDENDAVITTAFIMGIKRADGYVESILVPAGGLSVDGLTATGCVRGLKLTGLDYTTAGSGLAVSHLQDEAVFCNITGLYEGILKAAMQGTIATGGSGLILGIDADGTVTISRSTGVGTSVGWIRWNTSVDKGQFSDDGSVWVNFTDITSSFLVKNSAADTTQGYLASKLVAGTNITLTTLNGGGNETLSIATTNTDPLIATTAKEAITDGKPTAWSSTSNQVENLVNSSFSAGDAGSAVTMDTNTSTRIASCQAAANKVAAIFRDTGSSWYVIAGTVAPDTKVITWGTRQQIATTAASVAPSVTYLAEDAVVFTYVDSSNVLRARAATLSGTVFTFDTERQVHAATVDACAVSTVDTDKVLFCFNDSVTFGRTSIGTLATGVLTVDTANEQALFAANAISQISACKAATAKGFAFFRDNTSQDGTQVAISCGSTTPAPGSAVVVDANNCTSGECSQITTDSVLVAWRDTTSNVTNARVASIAGTVVTNPTAELSVSSVADCTDVHAYAYSSTGAIIAWRDVTSSKGSFQNISISSTTLATVGAPVDYFASAISATAPAVAIAKVNDNSKLMIFYRENGVGNISARVYQGYSNTDRYAGIAQSTVAAAASLNVRQIGTDDAQTGLTVGTIVSSNGIPIGKAITTTSMEVIVPPAGRFGLDMYGTDLSATDDYVVNLNPAPTAYTTGMQVTFKAVTANTGAATLNVNRLGPKAITKAGTVALGTGDIVASQSVTVVYDGTQFQIPASAAGFSSRFFASQGTVVSQRWLNAATAQPVIFNGETFDTLSEYDTTGQTSLTTDVGTGTSTVIVAAGTWVAGDVGAAFTNNTRGISSVIATVVSATEITISPTIAAQTNGDTVHWNRSWFIPAVSGFYQVNTNISLEGTTGAGNEYGVLSIFVNGAVVASQKINAGPNAATGWGGCLSSVLSLTAGQKLVVKFENAAGALVTVTGTDATFATFSAHRLS